MTNGVYEKICTYDGVKTYIYTPEDAKGLTFVAPGALVEPNDQLISTIRDALLVQNHIVAIPDIGRSEIKENAPEMVYGNFASSLKRSIDGYLEDHPDSPKQFNLLGHSMGGAAALYVSRDYPVSDILVLDPVPVSEDILQQVNAPVHMVLSKARSYRSAGNRMFGALEQNGRENKQTLLEHSENDTTKDHMYVGQRDIVRQIIAAHYSNNTQTPEPDNGFLPESEI